MRYVGSKSVLLADALSRLVTPGEDRTVPDLDVTIAPVMAIKSSRLQSIRLETKNNPSLTQLAVYQRGLARNHP